MPIPEKDKDLDPKAVVLSPKLLELLVCPLTKGSLEWKRDRNELVSRQARLAYPVKDGIPIMLPDVARELDEDEL